MISRALLLFALLAAPWIATAENPSVLTRFTLNEAKSRVRVHSPRLKAARAELVAASEQARSQDAAQMPRLSLEANYRYISEVPKFQLGPTPQPMGDNNNYSLGPQLSYVFWDSGASRNVQRSLRKMEEAKQSENLLVERQVLLSTRVAYVQAQLAQKELELSERSLALAQSQSNDIGARFRSGSASQLDALSARMEVSNYELRVAQARAEHAAALAELKVWVGDLPEALVLDPLDGGLPPLADTAVPTDHPLLRSQRSLAEGLRFSERGQRAGHWPTLQMQAKTSLDFPNGPKLERFHQNTLSVGLSWPIFEWGRTSAAVAQKHAEQEAASYRAEQATNELVRDWTKAKSRYANLLEQGQTVNRLLHEAQNLAKLHYQTYRAGRISLLEVQTSNLRLLDTEIRKARIEAQLRTQHQTLKFLNGEENL